MFFYGTANGTASSITDRNVATEGEKARGALAEKAF
jgi:hypothetical protein